MPSKAALAIGQTVDLAVAVVSYVVLVYWSSLSRLKNEKYVFSVSRSALPCLDKEAVAVWCNDKNYKIKILGVIFFCLVGACDKP